MYKNNKMEREENEYKLGGDENNIFFTQTTSFHSINWLENMKKCWTNDRKSNPCQQFSRFWSINTFMTHIGLLFLMEIELLI